MNNPNNDANGELSVIESLWREDWVKIAVISAGGVLILVFIALVYYCKVYDRTKKRSRHQSETREPRVRYFSS